MMRLALLILKNLSFQKMYIFFANERTGIMDIRENINDTRKGFEELFAAGDFYNRQTQDSEHLEKITEFVKIVEGMRVLDLGTGSGYLSFPLAKDNPGCEIIGLEIMDGDEIDVGLGIVCVTSIH